MYDLQKLSQNLYFYEGAVNTGILVSGNRAVLIDCCDTLSIDKLAGIGVIHVDIILCTQHRRPNVSGIYNFTGSGVKVFVPKNEKHLFDDVESYWDNPANRWHVYHHQPSSQILPCSIPVANTVKEGDIIKWEDFVIRVVETPGSTDGSVSYVLRANGTSYCFSGDLIYGPGKIWDLYSLQKGCIEVLESPDKKNYRLMDYHGFMGNRKKLVSSLMKIIYEKTDIIVPSHGEIIEDVKAAAMLIDRINEIYFNYCAISSINHYFPEVMDETKNHKLKMKPAAAFPPPDFVQYLGGTSFLLVSETGASLLVDCGSRSIIDKLRQQLQNGIIKSVDACWLTHYHDDHTDFLHELVDTFNCPVITIRIMADIIEHPSGYFLPCISPAYTSVTAVDDGYTWNWHEFELTSVNFPGQTLYHGGLLVKGNGRKVFFCGDSLSPKGIDDYCCGNRNFLGKGKGFRYCIDILRRFKPDYILNEHQNMAFAFTDEELDYMDGILAEREQMISGVVPWDHPDFGTDEWWVRTYPYEQEANPGNTVNVEVQFTNHGHDCVKASVEPVLPDGWEWDRKKSINEILVPGNTSGSTLNECVNPDKSARVLISIPKDAAGKTYVIPFRITWGDRYLGQFRHAVVKVLTQQGK